MKKYISLSLFVLSALGFSFWLSKKIDTHTASKKQTYKQRTSFFPLSQSWNGAAEYLFNLRKNPNTGTIDLKEIVKARKAVKQFKAQKSGTTFNWQEMGPDNYGGRTRAIIVDKTDPTGQRIYAGGVSGGLFVSNNGGGQWEPVQLVTEAVTISSMAQDDNGKIWIGTGSRFDNGAGTGNGQSSFVGTGMYTLQPGSTDILPVASAQSDNTTFNQWSYINELVCSANNIYAATNQGLMHSNNDGQTWTKISPNSNAIYDVKVLGDGSILTVIAGVMYRSTAAAPNTFTVVPGMPGGAGRMRIAVAPTNSNVMYALKVNNSGGFAGFYKSTDMGVSWGQVPTLSSFNPFGDNNQGNYDLMLQVDPQNENLVYIGGIDIWKYDNGTFTHITNWSAPNFLPYYVHADQHSSALSHANSSLMYFGCDGGVFRTLDGGNQFISSNRGYNVTQFYALGYSEQGWVMGGTQDNGTIAIDGEGYYQLEGNFAGGGDGFDAEFSQLTNKIFTTTYGEVVNRGTDQSPGGPFCGAWDCGSSFLFYTNIALWESYQATNSRDSVVYNVEDGSTVYTIQATDGVKTTYTGTVQKSQSSGNFVSGSIKFSSGQQVLEDLGTTGVLSGDGTGSFDYNTGEYTLTFNTAPGNNVNIKASYELFFNAGSTLKLLSNTPNVVLKNQNFTIDYTTPVTLQPGDSVIVQDPIQSMFVYGGPAGTIYFTRDGLKDGNIAWWTLAGEMLGNINAMEFSKDGNHLFVGTENGRMYRVSGFNNVYTDTEAQSVANGGQLSITEIFTQSGKYITGIGVDPNNPENVVVSLGGYGQYDHVFRSTSAVSATNNMSFSSIQGDLPNMPIYDIIISYDNFQHIIIGSEFGVYSSTLGNPSSWTSLNNGLPNVPVFAVRQQTFGWDVTDFEGQIYLGTHGRGIWKSSTLVSDQKVEFEDNNDFIGDLMVYPNPTLTSDQVKLKFMATKQSSVDIQVYSITGQLVYTHSDQAVKGENIMELPADLRSGNYMVSVQMPNKQPIVAKLLVY